MVVSAQLQSVSISSSLSSSENTMAPTKCPWSEHRHSPLSRFQTLKAQGWIKEMTTVTHVEAVKSDYDLNPSLIPRSLPRFGL